MKPPADLHGPPDRIVLSAPAPFPEGTTTGTSGDVEFAQMMIPHHEQAVEMADLALQNDSASVDVKALAGQIKAAQDPEIQTMKGGSPSGVPRRALDRWTTAPEG